VLWKAYIDFEIGEGQRARTRELYNRLLTRTGHVKVWLSYAQFEGTPLVLLRADADDLSDEERCTCCGLPPASTLLTSYSCSHLLPNN